MQTTTAPAVDYYDPRAVAQREHDRRNREAVRAAVSRGIRDGQRAHLDHHHYAAVGNSGMGRR